MSSNVEIEVVECNLSKSGTSKKTGKSYSLYDVVDKNGVTYKSFEKLEIGKQSVFINQTDSGMIVNKPRKFSLIAGKKSSSDVLGFSVFSAKLEKLENLVNEVLGILEKEFPKKHGEENGVLF